MVWRFFWNAPAFLRRCVGMNDSLFVPLAYGVTALLLGALCIATWLRARAVRHQVNESDAP